MKCVYFKQKSQVAPKTSLFGRCSSDTKVEPRVCVLYNHVVQSTFTFLESRIGIIHGILNYEQNVKLNAQNKLNQLRSLLRLSQLANRSIVLSGENGVLFRALATRVEAVLEVTVGAGAGHVAQVVAAEAAQVIAAAAEAVQVTAAVVEAVQVTAAVVDQAAVVLVVFLGRHRLVRPRCRIHLPELLHGKSQKINEVSMRLCLYILHIGFTMNVTHASNFYCALICCLSFRCTKNFKTPLVVTPYITTTTPFSFFIGTEKNDQQ